MHVAKLAVNGNPNVGLYGYCTTAGERRLCLFGELVGNEKVIAAALDSELVKVSIAGTPLPGVFLTGNTQALLVPNNAFDHEVRQLRELGLTVYVFHTRLTCLGNNIVANDHGCLVNPAFSDEEIGQLHELLDVPVKRMTIAGLETPGNCIVLNGKHGIIHREAASHEIEMARETLGLQSLEPASVNLGSPYLRAGILNNNHGFVIGDKSGGPEIVHIEESLGYLEK